MILMRLFVQSADNIKNISPVPLKVTGLQIVEKVKTKILVKLF